MVFLCICTGNAQETGTVLLQISPPIGTSVVKIGTIVEQKNNRVTVPAGTYTVTVWAPYYQEVTKTITVAPNETVTVTQKLVFNQASEDYFKAVSDYNHLAIRRKVLPRSATALLIAGSAVSWIRARRFQEQALGWKEEYKTSSSKAQIADYQRRFDEAKRKSINGKVTLYTLSGLSLAGTYLCWLGHQKMKAIEKPKIPTPSPPFEITSIGTELNQYRLPSFSLTLNF